MRKLDGLVNIEDMGLPHPEWEFVKNTSELKFVGGEDKWTILTCLDEGGDEFYLPHAENLSKSEVKEKIEEFKENLNRDATFVVYPSWDSNKAANIMLTQDKIIVEAVRGNISRLLYDGKPDLVAVFSRSSLPMKISSEGDDSLLTDDEVKMLIKLSNKINGEKLVHLSQTKNGNYLFHGLRELK